MRTSIYIFISLILALNTNSIQAQITPSSYEKIDYLITFGKNADKTWGDDDYTQVHFFVVPAAIKTPVYIRVFDPQIGGQYDTKNGSFDSKTSFSLYGGKHCFSKKEAQQVDPVNGYDSGRLIKKKVFGNESEYDNKWYTFGPVNPSEGEYSDKFKGYVFKMICEGVEGNDGNAYKYSLSKEKNHNVSIENGNIFTYEMTFKLDNDKNVKAHIYPFITKDIESITINTFDADDDIHIRITSIGRKLEKANVSLNGKWSSTLINILTKEYNSSIDIQLIQKKTINNDMTLHILNQYKNAIPLFSVPIGGKPSYAYKVKIKYNF